MPEQTVKLPNPSGLHARPAKLFAKAASEADANVKVSKDGREVNGESVLSILTLDCHQGDEITISAEGDNAEEAIAELVEMIESGLGEDTGS